MKTLKSLIIGMSVLFAYAAYSQVDVNITIGSAPQWGPAGYSDVRYYYLPDVECYYDIQSSRFIYYNGIAWVHRSHLPVRYRNYDLYNGYKVVLVDYRGERPYTNFHEYKKRYAKGYRGQAQRNIGENPGERPSKVKMDKKHSDPKVQHDNGRRKDPGHNKDKKNKGSHKNGKG